MINNTKIGKLAKEISEEIDIEDFGDFVNVEHPDDPTKRINHQDILQKILGKNPKKIMDMVKHIGDKMKNKFETGELKEEELVDEVKDMMGKFQNNKKFKKAFKSKQMQGMMEHITQMMGDPNGEGASPEKMSELFENMMRTGGNPAQKAKNASTRDRLRNKLSNRLMDKDASQNQLGSVPENSEVSEDFISTSATNEDDWIPDEMKKSSNTVSGKRHRKKKIKKKPPIPTY